MIPPLNRQSERAYSRFFPQGSILEKVHFTELDFDYDAPHTCPCLLHEELRRLGSVVIGKADEHQVPAGGALAVDREMWQN